MFEKTQHAIGGINVERQAAFLPMLQVIKMTPACIAHVRTSYHAPGNDRLGICPSSVAGRRTRRLGLRRLRCHGLPLSHPRSEERRVGKECRLRWTTEDE